MNKTYDNYVDPEERCMPCPLEMRLMFTFHMQWVRVIRWLDITRVPYLINSTIWKWLKIRKDFKLNAKKKTHTLSRSKNVLPKNQPSEYESHQKSIWNERCICQHLNRLFQMGNNKRLKKKSAFEKVGNCFRYGLTILENHYMEFSSETVAHDKCQWFSLLLVCW